MADEEKPQDGGPRDPLVEFGEKLRAKAALGKYVFDNVVLPRAKEVLGKAKDAAEGQFNKVKDSLDPTKGLERNSREVRDWFVEKGLSAKDANEMVIRTVTSALKTKKPLDGVRYKEKKND